MSAPLKPAPVTLFQVLTEGRNLCVPGDCAHVIMDFLVMFTTGKHGYGFNYQVWSRIQASQMLCRGGGSFLENMNEFGSTPTRIGTMPVSTGMETEETFIRCHGIIVRPQVAFFALPRAEVNDQLAGNDIAFGEHAYCSGCAHGFDTHAPYLLMYYITSFPDQWVFHPEVYCSEECCLGRQKQLVKSRDLRASLRHKTLLKISGPFQHFHDLFTLCIRQVVQARTFFHESSILPPRFTSLQELYQCTEAMSKLLNRGNAAPFAQHRNVELLAFMNRVSSAWGQPRLFDDVACIVDPPNTMHNLDGLLEDCVVSVKNPRTLLSWG